MRIVGNITFNSSKSSLYVENVTVCIFRLNKKPVRRIKLVMPRILMTVRVTLMAVWLKAVLCSK